MKYTFLLIFILTQVFCVAQSPVPATPKMLLELENRTVPVYNFDALEPLLKKNNDSTYVINFWATWCVPCVKELPYFEELLAKYQENKMKVILVSLDFVNQAQKSLLPYLKKNELKSNVVLLDDNDANRWINKVDSSWSGAIPATLIYNRSMRTFYEKSFIFEELETEYLKFKSD